MSTSLDTMLKDFVGNDLGVEDDQEWLSEPKSLNGDSIRTCQGRALSKENRVKVQAAKDEIEEILRLLSNVRGKVLSLRRQD